MTVNMRYEDQLQPVDTWPTAVESFDTKVTSSDALPISESNIPNAAFSVGGSPNGAEVSKRDGASLTAALRSRLEPAGFQCHPLLVGWYNDHVTAPFRLPYSDTTLAVLVLSTPSMFERCFLPYLHSTAFCADGATGRDPLDTCMRRTLTAAARRVLPTSRLLLDCDLDGGRRPRVLVQTAGHVSGAATLHRPEEVPDAAWSRPRPPTSGVCLHPQFGGWFAFRGVVIMDGVEAPDLERRPPPKILHSVESIRDLIELFNWHWRDWRWRDVGIEPTERYSARQRLYFATVPAQRRRLIEQWLSGHSSGQQEEDAAGEDSGHAG